MKQIAPLLFTAIVFVMLFSAHALYLKKTVYGDGSFYFSWLRSVVVDHDADFRNDYQLLGISHPSAPSGLPGNKYAVGPAILWAPVYISLYHILRGTGVEFPYQLALGYMSVGYALIGLLILYRIGCKYYGKTVSVMSTLTIALTTNLLFYGSVDPVNSHPLSFFAACLLLALILLPKRRSWFTIGIALGLLMLIRPQDVLYAILLLPFLPLASVPLVLGGATLTFLPQLFAWQTMSGTFWLSPYLIGGEGFDFLHPHILGVLFSLKSGLLVYTPSVLIGVVGIVLAKKLPMPKSIVLMFLLSQLYLVSSWSTWWQGASYSGRMFVSALPIINLGNTYFGRLIYKYSIVSKYYPLIIFTFTTINFFLILNFLYLTV